MNANACPDTNLTVMENAKMSMNVKLILLTIVQLIPNVITLLEHMNVNVLLVTNHLEINALILTNANSMSAIQMHHAPTPSEVRLGSRR